MFGLRTWLHAAPLLSRPLLQKDLQSDPFAQFDLWFEKSKKAGLPEPTAMSLCTVEEDGFPAQRMVLMKHISPEKGVMFYTNYGSAKAKAIDANPKVSLLFHYHILQRQIRVTGTAQRASREDSEAYFATRPRDSQLGAWASLQSEVLPDRETFEERFKSFDEKFAGQNIPCPEHWGGFQVIPDRFEFWQGRAFRLHDRFVYKKEAGDAWSITRLYP